METVAVDLADSSTTELVDAVAAIAAELARRPAPESATACMELTETLSGAIDKHEAALSAFIGVVDGAREVQRWGLPSTQAWLRARLGMREARAKERLILARHRHRLTQVTDRLAEGTLSYGHAATIAGAIARLDDHDCAAAQDVLLSLVDQGCSAGKVAAFGSRIREVIAQRDDTEAADTDTRRGYERSWIESTRSLDGGRYLKGWLNAEDAAIWDGSLAPLAKPVGTDDTRDQAERTAAALTAVLSGGHKATKVTLILDLDTLTGGTTPARLTDGSPIPPEQARRIALSAGVSPLILGGGNLPLYLGHRFRFASPGQRQVLETLYPTCAVEGCEVPGTLCEVDHVQGWALQHSPTDIDQLALACGWHNRFKHTHPSQVTVRRTAKGLHTYQLRSPGETHPRAPGNIHHPPTKHTPVDHLPGERRPADRVPGERIPGDDASTAIDEAA
ncbi:HNH endonuclease signature motif containing protein [Actinomadura terrae]|uniref:HNH endonuclease signature motif containing protein n=1 Tax=Actinomadura terrae TaxID=604353 RepID=UPI001FA70C55|nr:HNH endonuclease signature motif containing protein [Actinomadura terrae]